MAEDTICLFCGADATWDRGVMTCGACDVVNAILGETLHEYELTVLTFGCSAAKARLCDLLHLRGDADEQW